MKKRRKLDGIDHEQLTSIIESRGWQLIRERLERALRLKQEELEAPKNEVDTATIRGYIGGLKTALGVPAILLSEAKENMHGDTEQRDT